LSITLKTEEDLIAMRQAGRAVNRVLAVLGDSVKAGMRTKELDEIARKELDRMGLKPSFLGYHGYPARVCVSINEQIVHGIPGQRVIKEGDIVSLDFGAIYDGFQGDSAITVGVGKISRQAQELMDATKKALEAGIKEARDGARLGDIGAAIQAYAESRGFAIVKEYTGHGIGRAMHEDPLVPNFGTRGAGLQLRKGMTLAIEPMLSAGDWHTVLGADKWVVSTADGSLSAHFEHTIAITDGEPEILTAV
jgi:methionyl aminopeptidase